MESLHTAVAGLRGRDARGWRQAAGWSPERLAGPGFPASPECWARCAPGSAAAIAGEWAKNFAGRDLPTAAFRVSAVTAACPRGDFAPRSSLRESSPRPRRRLPAKRISQRRCVGRKALKLSRAGLGPVKPGLNKRGLGSGIGHSLIMPPLPPFPRARSSPSVSVSALKAEHRRGRALEPGVAQTRVRVDLEQQQPLCSRAGAGGEHLRGEGRAGRAVGIALIACRARDSDGANGLLSSVPAAGAVSRVCWAKSPRHWGERPSCDRCPCSRPAQGQGRSLRRLPSGEQCGAGAWLRDGGHRVVHERCKRLDRNLNATERCLSVLLMMTLMI